VERGIRPARSGSWATCSESLPEKGIGLQGNRRPSSSLSFRNTTGDYSVPIVFLRINLSRGT
jgi:hypothetical protein